MVQARLIRTAFLLASCSALAGLPLPEHPPGTVVRSLLDDLVPEPSLRALLDAQYDFRGCDRSDNPVRVADFWTADVKDLHTLKPLEPDDARANDRDWCHVNDFWTAEVSGLYTLVSGVAIDTNDPAIKLIELSIASTEEEEEP